jgi:hypothetical protein
LPASSPDLRLSAPPTSANDRGSRPFLAGLAVGFGIVALVGVALIVVAVVRSKAAATPPSAPSPAAHTR